MGNGTMKKLLTVVLISIAIMAPFHAVARKKTPKKAPDKHGMAKPLKKMFGARQTNASNLPVINRRSVKTTVRVKNGQTILIGGLLHKEKNKLHQKVMLLGDVPVLGGLFRSTTDVTVQTEVLIFITPHLMTDSYRARSLQQRKRFQQ